MLWRKLEIIVAFIALAFFTFHDYERADFLMLFLIYNRLIFPEFLKQVLWRYIPDTPHVQYWYAESEHYILKFPNGTYGFVMARSPREAYENFVKENSKEAK